ncbi:MAG: nucleotidyl transferase AbiEii/AbiGii toxin family protein [Thaumarchaeota archaeon]|nr:nucleotidyl transferase AbiEii/AbiGii toxin family protein [Nitrososphaerota archaeon]
MRRDLVNETSQLLGIKNKEMIEKDIILHEILYEISKDRFFSDNFAFKGGTCLVKAHLGYFRFSEDIDFTWKKQNIFEKKSQKKIRSYLSDVINKTGKVFEDISQKRGLDFRFFPKFGAFVILSP